MQDETKPLYIHKPKVFHNLSAKGLYLSKRDNIGYRGGHIFPHDTCHVSRSINMIKLMRYMRYLSLTTNFPLILKLGEINVFKWIFDSAYTDNPMIL